LKSLPPPPKLNPDLLKQTEEIIPQPEVIVPNTDLETPLVQELIQPSEVKITDTRGRLTSTEGKILDELVESIMKLESEPLEGVDKESFDAVIGAILQRSNSFENNTTDQSVNNTRNDQKNLQRNDSLPLNLTIGASDSEQS